MSSLETVQLIKRWPLPLYKVFRKQRKVFPYSNECHNKVLSWLNGQGCQTLFLGMQHSEQRDAERPLKLLCFGILVCSRKPRISLLSTQDKIYRISPATKAKAHSLFCGGRDNKQYEEPERNRVSEQAFLRHPHQGRPMSGPIQQPASDKALVDDRVSSATTSAPFMGRVLDRCR